MDYSLSPSSHNHCLCLKAPCYTFIPIPSSGNQEAEDLDDAELLASLEAQEEIERVQEEPGPDSGYWTLTNTSTQSLRSLVPTISSR